MTSRYVSFDSNLNSAALPITCKGCKGFVAVKSLNKLSGFWNILRSVEVSQAKQLFQAQAPEFWPMIACCPVTEPQLPTHCPGSRALPVDAAASNLVVDLPGLVLMQAQPSYLDQCSSCFQWDSLTVHWLEDRLPTNPHQLMGNGLSVNPVRDNQAKQEIPAMMMQYIWVPLSSEMMELISCCKFDEHHKSG